MEVTNEDSIVGGNVELKQVKRDLEAGKPRKEEIRKLLSWFGAQRRGVWVSQNINEALAKLQLKTRPPFENGYIDEVVEFLIAEEPAMKPECEDEDPFCYMDRSVFVPEIGMLPSANCPPTTVRRDDPLEKATSLMLLHNFSQLPVAQSGRSIDGIITWQSIGRFYAKNSKQADYVRECFDPFIEIIDRTTPLFEATQKVIANNYVLVRDGDATITGIVTTTDVSEQFRDLSEAFLRVGEIENAIRNMLSGKFRISELQSFADAQDTNRSVKNLNDLTFGEYVRIFEDPTQWQKLNLKLDRNIIASRLDTVRRIRNDIMHFHPDGISKEDIAALEETARFLRTLTA